MTKKRRVLILVIALVIFVAALIMNAHLVSESRISQLASLLRDYGYTLIEDDLYLAGSAKDASIASILPDMDLDEAVEASKLAGFNSDIHANGYVELVLLALENDDIVTIYTLDGEVELCFIQRASTDEVYSITTEPSNQEG